MDREFQILRGILVDSRCAKKHVAAGTWADGIFLCAVNHCDFEGTECPRLTLPSGQGYELCRAHHAEEKLAQRLVDRGEKSDGIVWVLGHYWACEPCASALKAVGVREIRVRETCDGQD